MAKPQTTTTVKTTIAREEPTPKPTVLDEAINNTRSELISRAASMLMVRPERLLQMLRNVWTVSKGQSPLTDEELFVGVSMIAKYELDPTAKEIYVTRNKDGRLMTIIGIDGFVKILCRTEGYDGFEQYDDFGPDKGKSIRSITTTIWHKDRSRPTSYTAYADEYSRVGGFVSKAMPTHMLRLFSLRHCIRLFTPIGGQVITEEEFHAMARNLEDSVVASGTKSERLSAAMKAAAASKSEEPVAAEPVKDVPGEAFVVMSQDDMRSKVEAELALAKNVSVVERIRFVWSDCAAINTMCDERLQELAALPNEDFQLGDPHQMAPLTGSQYYDQEG